MPYSDVFLPDPEYDREGFDIQTMVGRNKTDGDIGIEIECEGNKFPKQANQLPAIWAYHQDGSLRGKDNAEYVLKKPIKFEDAAAAVHELYQVLSDFGTVLDDSNRTSVHVHLNVQSFHLPRLTTFLGLYFLVEEILTEWCGDHRVGNLFCLRAKDASAIVSKIKKWIVADGKYELTEGLHYSGMNAQALVKFGSLEIRSLRGVSDPGLIVEWIGVLERIYKLSADYKDPRDVTENYSGNDPLDFLRGVLGPHYDVVRAGIEMTDDEVRASMKEGIRLAQDLCYCRDWSRYKPADVKKDPFRRGKKTSTTEDFLQHEPGIWTGTPAAMPAPALAPGETYQQFVQMYGTNGPATAPATYTPGGFSFNALAATVSEEEPQDFWEPELDFDEDDD